MNLLKINNLTAGILENSKVMPLIKDITFDLQKKEHLGIIGESGSGKSLTAFSLLGSVDFFPGIIDGEIWFGNQNLLQGISKDIYHKNIFDLKKISAQNKKIIFNNFKNIKGTKIVLIPQDAQNSFDPLFTIESHCVEYLIRNKKCENKKQAVDKILFWLEKVNINNPSAAIKLYPNQISGGMAQRIAVAIALAMEPEILIADEPTTALDATIQAGIIELFLKLMNETDITFIFISHDIKFIKQLSKNVIIMYGGRIVEKGISKFIFEQVEKIHPLTEEFLLHPYLTGLVSSIPEIEKIKDQQLNKRNLTFLTEKQKHIELDEKFLPASAGCAFYHRCRCWKYDSRLQDLCFYQHPELKKILSDHYIACWKYFS